MKNTIKTVEELCYELKGELDFLPDIDQVRQSFLDGFLMALSQ